MCAKYSCGFKMTPNNGQNLKSGKDKPHLFAIFTVSSIYIYVLQHLVFFIEYSDT